MKRKFARMHTKFLLLEENCESQKENIVTFTMLIIIVDVNL